MPLLYDRRAADSFRKPLIIAHRGASGLAPENTLAAFKMAIALGVDGVEMDVQLTADGRPVIIHDSRLNRTTNGKGIVSRLTLDQIQTLDAGSWFERRLNRRPRARARVERLSGKACDAIANLSGEPVPTLGDALSLLAGFRLERVYIELKGNPENRRALLDAVLSVVRELRVERSITLLSFDHAIVRRARETAGDIRTAALFPPRGRRLISTRSIIRAAESAGVDEAALHFGLATRRAVEALHERGFSVSAWTANSRLSMRRLAGSKVDSIMTNYPDRLRDVLDSTPRRHAFGQRARRGR